MERTVLSVRRPAVVVCSDQIEFLQTPGYVLILFERAHTYRIIPTDTRPHIGADIQLCQGDSRGHWDGNTLVVDVTNHDAKPWFDQAGHFYSNAAHMVERFTLIDLTLVVKWRVTIQGLLRLQLHDLPLTGHCGVDAPICCVCSQSLSFSNLRPTDRW